MANILNNKIEKSYSLENITGNDIQKTLFFKIDKCEVLPGQFYMLNYRGFQKPFSVSHYDNNMVGFTIQNRGEGSKLFIKANKGEYFGLTGPLGNSFKTGDYKNILIIGGGIGIAPVYFLSKTLTINYKALFGGRNISNVDFANKPDDKNILFYTEDGSFGKKGFVTLELDEILSKNKFDACFICGPEKMMKIVIDKLLPHIKNIYISMERYMKCGLGICGSCCLDGTGDRVCKEGPVFSYDRIKLTPEFGLYHRNDSGVIINE